MRVGLKDGRYQDYDTEAHFVVDSGVATWEDGTSVYGWLKVEEDGDIFAVTGVPDGDYIDDEGDTFEVEDGLVKWYDSSHWGTGLTRFSVFFPLDGSVQLDYNQETASI